MSRQASLRNLRRLVTANRRRRTRRRTRRARGGTAPADQDKCKVKRPLTLQLIDNGAVDGDSSKKKYTIVLQYDPDCHDVESILSSCKSMAGVQQVTTDFAKAAATWNS